jgi:hypothetical protein
MTTKRTKGQTMMYKTLHRKHREDRVTRTPLNTGDELRCSGTDIGDIGHTKHKTKTNKANQKRNKKGKKTKQNKTKQNKTKTIPQQTINTQHNTKTMCNTDTTTNQR